MRKKAKRFRQIRVFLLFGTALTLLLILIASRIGKQNEFGAAQKIALEVVGIAQAGVSRITTAGSTIWQSYLALVETQAENRRLNEELLRYKAINNEFREAVATNVRLRKLLDLKETIPSPSITAQIIGKDPSLWFKTVVIDRGSSDGVQKGMPVVTVEGIVGQVMSVSPHFAKVLLANDPNSAIDTLIQRSRVHGILKGSSENSYQLQYVLKKAEVHVGDDICTSGLGGVFPKGLPVGKVSKVVENPAGMFQEIEIMPSVDFSELEFVIIILTKSSLAE